MPYRRNRLLQFLARLESSYAVVRLLSIDVALAALGGGVMAAKVTGGRPRVAFFFLLPAAVWVVYTLDHLLDGRRMGGTAATPRHRFHRDHATPLWVALGVVTALCAAFGWKELDRVGLFFGFSLACLFALHELLVKLAGNSASPLLIKELGVALIFTAGTWGLPWLRRWQSTGHAGGRAVPMVVQYFLLAGANLILFSIFEAAQDRHSRQTSVVQLLGTRRALRIVYLLVAVQIVVGGCSYAFNLTNLNAELVLLAIAACHLSIAICPALFTKRERFRTLADGAFLLPLLLAW